MTTATATITETPVQPTASVSAPVVPSSSLTGPGRPQSDAPVTVSPLKPSGLAAWERFVHAHPDGEFSHSVVWMHSVRDAFGHQPRYLQARRRSRLVGVLPLFEVNSLLAGRLLVSVPYGVGGGVLANDQTTADSLLEAALKLAAEREVRTLDLRSAKPVFSDLENVTGYNIYQRELPATPDDVLTWIPRKARAAARNAENKFGLTIEHGGTHLRTVWKLYARSMRRLGSLAYPYRFFEELYERNDAHTHVQVARLKGRIIGGLVSFSFRDTFTPYFVGCNERFRHTGVNNFIYWKAMELAVATGCRIFDFGRTREDNTGCANFKRFHGFEPRPLGYQRWVAPGAEAVDLKPSNPRYSLARRVWPHLPQPVCNTLGAAISRHIPG